MIKKLFINKDVFNISSAFILKVSGTLLNFLLNIILARSLGADGLGSYNIALTITSVTVVVTRFGLDNALLRFVSAAFARDDWKQIKGLHKVGLAVSSIVGIILTAIIVGSSELISESIFDNQELSSILWIMALTIVPNALINLYSEIFKGLGRVKIGMFFQGFLIPFLNLFLILALINNLSSVLAVFTYTISNFIVILICHLAWLKASSNYKQIKGSFDKNKLLSVSFPLLWVSSMNLIIDVMDTIMIGIFRDSWEVGVYSTCAKIAFMSSMVMMAINSVAGPKFSVLWSENKLDQLKIQAKKYTRHSAIIAVVITGFFILFRDYILLIFGEEFLEGSTIFLILILGQFLVLATGPVAYLLMMTGHHKFHRNNVLLCAVLNLILNLILLPHYGALGVAFSTAIALAIKNLQAFIFVKRKLGFWTI
ncbi:oligosaccharide flippase family protein [Alkalihalobacillus rhizosphaerae]|nr:oligosaccharide flippase family protein [Shouchella rhizosphaerae]